MLNQKPAGDAAALVGAERRRVVRMRLRRRQRLDDSRYRARSGRRRPWCRPAPRSSRAARSGPCRACAARSSTALSTAKPADRRARARGRRRPSGGCSRRRSRRRATFLQVVAWRTPHMQPGCTGEPGNAPAWNFRIALAAVMVPSLLGAELDLDRSRRRSGRWRGTLPRGSSRSSPGGRPCCDSASATGSR